jgi:AAA ATPase domain
VRLIKKIEVNYFRSLYSATIDNLGNLNVIFGRNDSGKSNFLRALNLFFNEKPEPSRDFDFDLDMSDIRKQEARDVKGRQFIWIKITFNVPENYQSTLGNEITIKRQWNRDEEWNETVFPSLKTSSQQARLTRFINDIDFTYIPAIKDLNVYADLIERMYGAAAETAAIKIATDNFVDAIEGQTTALSTQLTTLFGSPARLAPPTEMSRLFRNLDFAHGREGHSMLRQKGDGIKARHIPELLRYINEKENRKKIFIWGFEEPENSLDLGAAEQEALRFLEFSRRADTQIFITSHSPAFYLIDGKSKEDAAKFFITKQEKQTDGDVLPANAANRIDKWEDAENKMEQAGLLQLPFVIQRMQEQRTALDKQKTNAEALRRQLEEIRTPTVFVEGPHDAEILNLAAQRAGETDKINFKSLGGAPSTTDSLLSAVLQQGGMNASAPTLFLFDDDKTGRSAFNKLCGKQAGSEPTRYKINTWAWLIPRTDEFKLFMRRHGIQSHQAFFTAEFLFPAEESARLCLEMIQSSDRDFEKWSTNIHGDYWPSLGQETCSNLAKAPAGSTDWLLCRGVPSDLKRRFLERTHEIGNTSQIDAMFVKIKQTLIEKT